jgi:serine-type D-Ala-D-Ala carboxypeptidase/endopeptidase (penicillin-binding protein 4)
MRPSLGLLRSIVLGASALAIASCAGATAPPSARNPAHDTAALHSGPPVHATSGRGTIPKHVTDVGSHDDEPASRSAPSDETSPLRSAPWTRRIDRLVHGLSVSVAVGRSGRLVYAHAARAPRRPASNEKLLLSMSLLDRFGAGHRIATTVESRHPREHVVHGDLWLVGHGDPEVDASTMQQLARRIRAAGIRRVDGSVVGDTATFARDRWAPGWHPIALRFIGLPTALTFEGNVSADGFVLDPERRAAAALTADLRAAGVTVAGAPKASPLRGSQQDVVATARSSRLVDVLRHQNVHSNNLDAEVLDKMLGATHGRRGTIARGATVVRAWARRHGVRVSAHDGSGLSYRDRISARGMVHLLGVADGSRWGAALRSTLPPPGAGTLTGRLTGVRVRAKTGTLLAGVSALSGWVRSGGADSWLEFSILSEGLAKDEAISIEDAIVRAVARSAPQ